MKRFAFLLALIAASTMSVMAQNGNLTIKGSVFDYDSAEPLFPANIQVYELPDSTYINGTSTEDDGAFTLSGLKAGTYVARVSYMGYITTDKEFTLRAGNRNNDLGKITLKGDAQILSDVVVTAALAKVQMVGDTVVFNSDAYRLPEGSSVEDLVRKLPGVQITSDGNITVNGKTISRILVNGKEFFDNDRSVALNNLTAEMIEKIKTYDKQSDLARQTGIDDGNDETVLDLTVKKGMAQGWFGNVGVGYGRPLQETSYEVEDLYNVNANVNRFGEDRQMTIMASAGQSAGGMMGGGIGGGIGGFGGMRGMGGFGGGLSKNYNGGMNFARNLGPEISDDSYKYEIGGSINVSHRDSESQSKTASENFYAGGMHTWSNREGSSSNGSTSVSGQLRFEWNQSEKTSLIFTPQFSYSESGSTSKNISKTFNKDPYKYASNPLDIETVFESTDLDPLANYLDSLNNALWNSQNSNSMSESNSMSTSGNILFTQRFDKPGRNISLNANYSLSTSTGDSYSRNDQIRSFMDFGGNIGRRDTTIYNRYNDNPSKNRSLRTQISYTEPLANQTYLQLSYQFSYNYSRSDRSTYDLPQTGAYEFWGMPDWVLEDNYLQFKDDSLSQLSYYENFDQTIQLQLRKVTEKLNLTFGLSALPQHSKMNYNYMGLDTMLSRTVFNWTPTVNMRYRWTRQESLTFRYNGRTSQPSMTQLLDITDNSNPLAISMGNPGLKPTFSNSLNLNYQKYDPVSMSSISVGGSFSHTIRQITNKTTLNYDGGTISQPVNLDGLFANWNASTNVNGMLSMLDSRLTLNSVTSVNYRHQEGWASIMGQDAQLRTTLTTGVSETLNAAYRNDYIEVALQGLFNYSHSTNDLQPERNMNTFDFRYGPSFSVVLPWRSLRFATDMMMSSRRGYSAEMNTDELIWNAGMSVSVLKGNKGTISVNFYDILNQRSDVNRSMTATSRTDSFNQTINTYFMVNFSYRIQMFGDKEARQNMRGMRGGMGGFGGGMGGFGGGMGGFGGGMGGGMMGGGGFGGGFGGGGMMF
jgi:hypothetical protein